MSQAQREMGTKQRAKRALQGSWVLERKVLARVRDCKASHRMELYSEVVRMVRKTGIPNKLHASGIST